MVLPWNRDAGDGDVRTLVELVPLVGDSDTGRSTDDRERSAPVLVSPHRDPGEEAVNHDMPPRFTRASAGNDRPVEATEASTGGSPASVDVSTGGSPTDASADGSEPEARDVGGHPPSTPSTPGAAESVAEVVDGSDGDDGSPAAEAVEVDDDTRAGDDGTSTGRDDPRSPMMIDNE